ncbi:hypothetical protein N2152v2_005016 [Parachlorella kessleri]
MVARQLVLRACLVLQLLVVFAAQAKAKEASKSGTTPKNIPKYNPDRIIVKFKPTGLGPQAAAAARARTVSLPKGTSVEAALKAYQGRSDVEYAEPDYPLTPDATPNDPSYKDQWGIPYVFANDAWDISTGSSSVSICVIDSGIDFNHSDLRPNMGILNSMLKSNGNPMDELGHGTHVAGIIGAVGNNGQQVAGVNWKVNLMACRYMDASGVGWTGDASNCIYWCSVNGARVISASWSGDYYSQQLRDTINWAGTLGVLFVNSAGNKGKDLDTNPVYPAALNLPNQLTVASAVWRNNRHELSSFSNYSKNKVHIAGPGEGILSTALGGGTVKMSGTSQAAPFVSGAAALLLSVGPQLTPAQLKDLLMTYAQPSTAFPGKIMTGVVNVGYAIKKYRASITPSPSPSPAPASPTPSPVPSPAAASPSPQAVSPSPAAASPSPQAASPSPAAASPSPQAASPSPDAANPDSNADAVPQPGGPKKVSPSPGKRLPPSPKPASPTQAGRRLLS